MPGVVAAGSAVSEIPLNPLGAAAVNQFPPAAVVAVAPVIESVPRPPFAMDTNCVNFGLPWASRNVTNPLGVSPAIGCEVTCSVAGTLLLSAAKLEPEVTMVPV